MTMALGAVVKDSFGIMWRGITEAASSVEMRGPRYYDKRQVNLYGI